MSVSENWLRTRGYPHFDRPLPKGRGPGADARRDELRHYLKELEDGLRHRFLPFVRLVREQKRYKKLPDGTRKLVRKRRPVMYASHVDAALLSYAAEKLSRAYESFVRREPFDSSVLAYRRLGGACNVDFAVNAFSAISREAPCLALKFDLTNFFDTLRHEDLKAGWCRVIGEPRLPPFEYQVYRAVSGYSYVHLREILALTGRTAEEARSRRFLCSSAKLEELHRRNGKRVVHKHFGRPKGAAGKDKKPAGTPQGSPISAVLSNVAMIEFDAILRGYADRTGGHYFRYSDDILLVCPLPRSGTVTQAVAGAVEKAALAKVNAAASARGLILNKEKTETAVFLGSDDTLPRPSQTPGYAEEILYLGLTYDGDRVGLSPKSLQKHYRRARRAVARSQAAAGATLTPDSLFRATLLHKFSHLGTGRHGRRWAKLHRRSGAKAGNFLQYAFRTDAVVRRQSDKRSAVRGQVSRHMPKLLKMIDVAERGTGQSLGESG